MSWHVYRIFRVVALCALFSLHSGLIGITAVGMLDYEAGALQFSMDIIVLFTILCFSVLKYKRRNAEPSRLPNLAVFAIIFVLSLIGAIGLAARTASRKGKGICEDFASNHHGSCTVAVVAMTFTWVSVIIAGTGLVVSWLDRGSRMALLATPYDVEGPEKEPELPKPSRPDFRSSSSYVPGPTTSYIPRPRDPYDAPRRRRSDRSQLYQINPRRVPSNRAPVPPLPSLPSFDPLGLETDTVAARRIDHRETNRTRSDQKGHKDLPELPPPMRRPLGDPHMREIRRMRYISPTDMYAQMGG